MEKVKKFMENMRKEIWWKRYMKNRLLPIFEER